VEKKFRGAMALLAGRFPYAHTTYLGNVLHHLPGAFILATPFVALGTSALQSLFCLPVFFVVISEESDSRTALSLAWLIFALSPVVMYEVVTGTGYASNTIYVLLGLWWLVRTEHRAVAAIVWGVRQISHSAAWITGGLAGVFYSALAAIGRRKRREENQP
jgi:hypothetical protein